LSKRDNKLKLAKLADPQGHAQYMSLQRRAKAIEYKLKRDKLKEIRDQFFATADARYIEQQHRQDDPACGLTLNVPTPACAAVPSFDLDGRQVLPALLFPDL
jgi:hypothetical protein